MGYLINMLVEKVTNGYKDDRVVTIYKLHEFLTTDEIKECRTALEPLITKYKEVRKTKFELTEMPMFGNDYLTVDVSPNDYKIINPKSVKSELDAYSDHTSQFRFQTFQRGLRDAFTGIIIRGIETICNLKQISGKLTFRINLKSFVGSCNTGDTLKTNLGWHYDFLGETTMAFEILNDIADAGTLEFSRNCYAANGIYVGSTPYNQNCTKPLEESSICVKYPQNGAILFDGYRGKQIHRPVIDAVKSNETNTFTRVVLQVVLTDNEWADGK